MVPVHEAGPVVVDAIRSLLDQDYGSLTVLAIVDGSTNDDEDRLRAEFGDRIRLVVQENRGLVRTLNRAIDELVDTPLLARLDHDDLALPGRIRAQVDLLSRTGADVVFSALWRTGSAGRRLSVYPVLPSADGPVPYDPLRFGQIVHSTMLARVDVLRAVGGYRPEFWPADDYDLSIRLSRSATVLVDPVPRIEYRISSASESQRHRATMAANTRYLEKAASLPAEAMPPLADWLALNPIGWFEHVGLHGRWQFRSAGAAFGDGRPVVGALRLAAAGILNPRHVVRRLRHARRGQAESRSTSPT